MRIMLLVLAVQSAAPPLRWTTTFDRTGHCMYAVPPQWRDAREGQPVALMHAPDGAATVEQTWAPVTDWSAYAGHMRTVLRPTAVHEHTAQRLWLEYPAGWPGLHYYIAVPSAGGACVALLDMASHADGALRALLPQIIDTMGAAAGRSAGK
jgi:hypothetical protein